MNASKELGNKVLFKTYEGYNHFDWYFGNPYLGFDGQVRRRLQGPASSEKGRKETPGDENSLFAVSLADTLQFLEESGYLKCENHSVQQVLVALADFKDSTFTAFEKVMLASSAGSAH